MFGVQEVVQSRKHSVKTDLHHCQHHYFTNNLTITLYTVCMCVCVGGVSGLSSCPVDFSMGLYMILCCFHVMTIDWGPPMCPRVLSEYLVSCYAVSKVGFHAFICERRRRLGWWRAPAGPEASAHPSRHSAASWLFRVGLNHNEPAGLCPHTY